MINDDGVIRLYYGYSISTIAEKAHGSSRKTPDLRAMEKVQLRQFLAGVEQMMFHRPKEQLLDDPEDIMGANHVVLDGRKGEDRVNLTANNHGSLECMNGQLYIFYHRHTHHSTYSRQACVEQVTLQSDGSIRQAECTSCGLNGGPLIPQGVYPAAIACNITNGQMPHIANRILEADIPYVTHSGEERYIANIKSGTRIVFKYFAFDGPVSLRLLCRCKGGGAFEVATGKDMGKSGDTRRHGLAHMRCDPGGNRHKYPGAADAGRRHRGTVRN